MVGDQSKETLKPLKPKIMTDTLKQEKRRLQAIIDNNNNEAENGSASAQMQVISAQADLDRIAQSELAQYIASTPLPKPLILVD
jgi:hypothetical protein